MDTRIALEKNTVLKSKDSGLSYTILDEIARGGSCIVYDAVYTTASGVKKPVRLKECYPFHLNIKRTESGRLLPDEEETLCFEHVKESIQRAFHDGNSLFLTKGLTNATSNMLQCFEENNTVYIPSVYLEGQTLSADTFSSLKDCVSIVKTVSLVVQKIHEAGYLYLDIKPENVFVITNAEGKGATELVQLFDFDSLIETDRLKMPDMQNMRLSYTQGFAALEHQMGHIHKLGYHTDVYSIGALLFYLIFGVPPHAMDCEEDAAYDFGHSQYGDTGYQDQLFFKLTEFFHRTLANYYPDRYKTMKEAAEKLDEILRLADTEIPFVISTKVAAGKKFVGRDAELCSLKEWLSGNQSACLFLTGMGGIGKSTLARKFLAEYGANLDTVLYLYFQDSVIQTLIDDVGLQVNTVEQVAGEKDRDYFDRKIKKLRKLLYGTNSLLVIDNFTGEITKEFLQMLSVGWKVLVLSRDSPPSDEYTHLALGALHEEKELYQLFQNYTGRAIVKADKKPLDRIIDTVAGHTLVLELIARQVQKSQLTVAEAEKLVHKFGFSNIAPEKVTFEKDSETRSESVKQIISAVFFCKDQNPEKRRILKALSLFAQPGIDVNIFCEMLKLQTKDSLNELCEESWITYTGTQLSMHPVIQETIGGWEWTWSYRMDTEHILEFLYQRLRFEEEEDALGRPEDYKLSKLFLQLAESVLACCRKKSFFQNLNVYKHLLGYTILRMPTDREAQIIQYTQELSGIPSCQNQELVMRVYQKLISVYLEQRDFHKAQKTLIRIKALIRGNDPYMKAKYYDILSDFYDTRLDGQYASDNEYRDLAKLKRAIDKSIFHLKLSQNGHKKTLLIRYTLNKINVLIRSTPEKTTKIKRLLDQVKGWIEKNADAYSSLRRDYCLSAAWYYTLSNPCKETAEEYCLLGMQIARKICPTELEFIDRIAIPYANMMAEFSDLDQAKEILLASVRSCSAYPAMLPYIRKKMDLFGYLLEVCYFAGNPEDCRKVIAYIEHERALNQEYELQTDIPEEIREFVSTNPENKNTNIY